MERLTEHYKYQDGLHGYTALGYSSIAQRPFFGIIKRLAEYEDTGLMPDEIPKWTSVREDIKIPYEPILVMSSDGRIKLSQYGCVEIDSYEKSTFEVTYWMPLPKPPKVQASNELKAYPYQKAGIKRLKEEFGIDALKGNENIHETN